MRLWRCWWRYTSRANPRGHRAGRHSLAVGPLRVHKRRTSPVGRGPSMASTVIDRAGFGDFGRKAEKNDAVGSRLTAMGGVRGILGRVVLGGFGSKRRPGGRFTYPAAPPNSSAPVVSWSLSENPVRRFRSIRSDPDLIRPDRIPSGWGSSRTERQ